MYNTILDEINIKNLPEFIASYFKKHDSKKVSNLRGFYNMLLCEISEDVKASYLNRILKYLSETSPSLINIFEDFNQNIYDEQLLSFSKSLVMMINKYIDSEEFYELLNRKINYIFYEKDEFIKLKETHNEKNYEEFIFLLLKHAFEGYQSNLPGIVGMRFYEEALSAGYNSRKQIKMLQASADLGNVNAAILYSSYLLNAGSEEAVDYLLKAKTKPYILWLIGFSIEKHEFSKYSILKIKKELSEFFIEDSFIDKISCDDSDIYLAVKIYYFIYKKYHFSRSINSLGKLLINKNIIYNNSDEETIMVAKKILKEAIKLGNINAITNLSAYYIKNESDSEYDLFLIEKLLKTSANLGDEIANFYYGKLLSKNNIEEGLKYLTYASEHNHYKAAFELGKIYELRNDYTKALEYYNRAISLGYYDAAINLAKLYILMYSLYDKNIYIIYAKDTLDDNYSRLTDKCKLLADKLYKDIKI